MAHTADHTQEQFESRKEVRNVTIILSVLTLVELALGFWMFKAGLTGFIQGAVKGTIIILMLAKAFYIVAYFMHLGHEVKNLIMTIVVPLSLFIWFIIAFLYDGNSYRHLRNTYDRHHYEQSQQQAPAQHQSHGVEDAPGHEKPAVEE
jgi:cytochrome c oxidase subunit IV